MLRDLNLNEMNLVSGGAAGGSGDEIIVTGTIIRRPRETYHMPDIVDGSEYLQMLGLTTPGVTGPSADPGGDPQPVDPTPSDDTSDDTDPTTPDPKTGSPGVITTEEAIKCGLLGEERVEACLAKAMLD